MTVFPKINFRRGTRNINPIIRLIRSAAKRNKVLFYRRRQPSRLNLWLASNNRTRRSSWRGRRRWLLQRQRSRQYRSFFFYRLNRQIKHIGKKQKQKQRYTKQCNFYFLFIL